MLFRGRETLQEACAPPHEGRGRGPLIFGYLAEACFETNVQKAMGGAGVEREARNGVLLEGLPSFKLETLCRIDS